MSKFQKQVNIRFSIVEWDKILLHASRQRLSHASFIRQCIDTLLLRGNALPLNSIAEYQIYGIRLTTDQYNGLHQINETFGQSISWLVRSEVLNTLKIQSTSQPVSILRIKARASDHSNAEHCPKCKQKSLWLRESRKDMFCTSCGNAFKENIYA